jgi:dTMP kinase
MKGKFIVFEGIDGSGKGTQMMMAAQYIYSASGRHDVLLTREPTKRLVSDDYIGDRMRHVNEVIVPCLESGVHVLCDRYLYSTMAYQGDVLHPDVPEPDLVIVLDCPVDLASTRVLSRGVADDMERDHEIQRRARGVYLSLTADNIVVLDASRTADTVAMDVRQLIKSLLHLSHEGAIPASQPNSHSFISASGLHLSALDISALAPWTLGSRCPSGPPVDRF